MFEQKINEMTDNKYGLRLKEATLNKKSGQCFVELFYNDGVVLDVKTKSDLERRMISILPKNFEYQFKFVKNYFVKEVVIDSIKKYLGREYPSLIFGDLRLEKEDNSYIVYLKIDENQLDYANHRGLTENLEKAIDNEFMTKVRVVIETMAEKQEEEVEESPVFEEENLNEGRFISVENVEPIIGNLTDKEAYYIKDKKQSEEEVVFCGRIKFIKVFSYTPKRKKAEEKPEEGGEIKERKFFKFLLEDFTDQVSCTYFSSSQTEPKMALLKENDSVIVSGKLEEDKYTGGNGLMVKNISRCTLPEKFEEEITYNPLPEKYRYVFPEPVEHYTQADLFTGEKPRVNEFFMKHDVVVYDFETTGTRVDGGDKIVEIGAVKVHEGKIIESFSCLVNPEMHIPASATAVHGIKDEDVKSQHTFSEVLADFYKFTHGCYLSGYNIEGFDNIYLTHFGKLSGYNFDNPSIDVYKLAQRGVRGVKNYKLKTIAEKLNVALDHAHRAVNDTVATAEVLFKLSEMMDIG